MALKRVSGVHDAQVSFESGRGVVTFAATETSPEEFIGELERLTGFTAEVITTQDSTTHQTGSVSQDAER